MTEQLRETRAAGLDLRPLRENLDGDAIGPDDPSWDEARSAWNLAVDQRPAAVVLAESALDVVAAVAFAREHGLRIAPQGTGHGAAALGDLDGTILLRTSRMRGVEIDPQARIARVEAGALWIDVVEAAAEHGLAALAGSSPDVGVVGYTLGGGLSWLSRKYGIGSNQVTAIEGVTASGDSFRTDRDNEPDLFWALRGGGGSFAIVTAIEFNLFPLEEVYAGILWFPVERAAEILKVWRAWTDDLPDEMTSVGRILQFPPIPEIPEPVRGKSFVVVEAIWLGEPAEGARLLEPLRGLGPIMDTVAPMPVAELSRLHMDPEGPAPGVGDGGMLSDVDDELIDAFVERVVGTPILSAELRHLGGAVATALVAPRRDRRLGGAVHHVRARDRADPRARRRGARLRLAAHERARAVGGRAHVPELRRDPAQADDALLERQLPPVAPDQGDSRPRRPDQVQPSCATRQLSIRLSSDCITASSSSSRGASPPDTGSADLRRTRRTPRRAPASSSRLPRRGAARARIRGR